MTSILQHPRSDLSLSLKTDLLIRTLDLIVAATTLVVLSPLFLVLALVIRFTSPGPVFYAAERVGQGGRRFCLLKFRSMIVGADQVGPGITVKDDIRITPIGRLLRRTKWDELPQLINVLRGEMSLVGPRPEDPRYVSLYTAEQRQVLSVRPGLTSPASLHYRSEETLLRGFHWEHIYREQIMPHKLSVDLAYLRQRTFWSDLGLLLQTLALICQTHRLTDILFSWRNRHFLLLDILVLMFIPTIALALRLEGFDSHSHLMGALCLYTGVALLIKLVTFYPMGLYGRYWRYASVNDLNRILVAAGCTTVLLTVLFILLYPLLDRYELAMFRTVPIIDGLVTGLVIGCSRLSLRSLYQWQRRSQTTLGGRRTLIVGAGEAGTLVVREIRANPQIDLEPVAFVDDDLAKIGIHICGVPVMGSSRAISLLVEQYRIERIIVALPSVALSCQQEIISRCQQTGVATYSLPGIYQLLAGHKTISDLPKVDIQQLLQRELVQTDLTGVAALLQGATVLVTGAGGSIGSELCRQIARLQPAEIILLGHGENSIFEIDLDLRLAFPRLKTQPVIADVRDISQINQIVARYRPQIIFHAAAHKHVHLMETNVVEAVTTNILGTRNVLQAAEQHGVEHFVLISTDKAVNPTSIMGATKRLAELLVISAAQRSRRPYLAVRFGNVLGSRGSVIPVFQRQIAAGGPVTVTHPQVRRYFMTIPEAVQLVLQAMSLGQGGEVFILDMGEPVRILDLAINMIKLSGLEPERDIEIVYTGLRPGEKLDEELFLAGEAYQRTEHHQVLRARAESNLEAAALEQVVLELVRLSQEFQGPAGKEQMQALLPKICYYIDQYQPQFQPSIVSN